MARLKEPDRLPVKAEQTKIQIEQDSARWPVKQCAKCAGGCFHRHQKRQRWFLVVVDGIVHPIHCWLCRWRCVNCGTTFVHLPSLCVPFKRYLRDMIETLARIYIETHPLTYRQVVKEGASAVVYDDPVASEESSEAEKEAEAVRMLAPSTPHRWISSIGACREQCQSVVQKSVQLAGGLGLLLIAVSKYRSEARRRVLEACLVVLRALKIVRTRNPTDLATLASIP